MLLALPTACWLAAAAVEGGRGPVKVWARRNGGAALAAPAPPLLLTPLPPSPPLLPLSCAQPVWIDAKYVSNEVIEDYESGGRWGVYVGGSVGYSGGGVGCWGAPEL